MRCKLARQLRSQDKSFFKDLKIMMENMFPVINDNFFTSQRPIFFEESAKRDQNQVIEAPKEILLFLVHGLGACRLDMEKIKVELRRYYDYKVKIFISTSNEARTEGHIEAMGERLAH